MANLMNGADMMLFINGKSIACATNASLTLSTTMLDVTSPGHKDIGTGATATAGWDDATPQSHSWSASTENLFASDPQGNSFDDLFKAYKQGTSCTAYFGWVQPHNDVGSGGYAAPGSLTYSTSYAYYYGNCVVSNLTANAPYEGKATFTAEFQGKGELSSSNEPYSA